MRGVVVQLLAIVALAGCTHAPGPAAEGDEGPLRQSGGSGPSVTTHPFSLDVPCDLAVRGMETWMCPLRPEDPFPGNRTVDADLRYENATYVIFEIQPDDDAFVFVDRWPEEGEPERLWEGTVTNVTKIVLDRGLDEWVRLEMWASFEDGPLGRTGMKSDLRAQGLMTIVRGDPSFPADAYCDFSC